MGNQVKRNFGDLSLGDAFDTKSGKGFQRDSIVSGYRYLMCPHCYHLELLKNVHIIQSVIYDSDPKARVGCSMLFGMRCTSCGQHSTDLDLIDYEIGNLVGDFNRIGLFTLASCQGGGEYYNHCEAAYILFEYNIIEDVVNKYPLPDTWKLEPHDDIYKPCLRSVPNFDNPKKVIKDLTNWLEDWTKKEYLI